MNSSTVTKNDLLNELLQFESYYSDNNYNPINDQAALKLNHKVGDDSKFLFCAPHALNHYRNNNLKIADIFTGSLCQLLADKTNQPGLVATCPDNRLEHFGLGRDYINHIKDAVGSGLMIVDIHGMSDRHNFDVCIGTGPKPSERAIYFTNKLVNWLTDYKVSINYPFNARSNHTITNFVQTKLSGDSIQIEIASRLRCADSNSEDCKLFLDNLINFFDSY